MKIKKIIITFFFLTKSKLGGNPPEFGLGRRGRRRGGKTDKIKTLRFFFFGLRSKISIERERKKKLIQIVINY